MYSGTLFAFMRSDIVNNIHTQKRSSEEFKIPWSSELLESFLVSFFKKFIFHNPAGQMTLALKRFLNEKSSFSETGTPF